MSTETVLQVKNLSKSFGKTNAVDSVSLSFRQGEVHSLIGENGAGKSTLMNLITGLLEPDTGEIFFRKKKVNLHSPADSLKLGIGIVHQHFMLIDRFTAIENIILGNEQTDGLFLNIESSRTRVKEIQEQFGFSFDLKEKVRNLTVGEKQQIEIVKILFRNASFFIFDEPTAVLSPFEVEGLYNIFRKLKKEGHSIIFISHKLKEVFKISDRISVMRSGKIISTNEIGQITREEVAIEMVGHRIEDVEVARRDPGDKVLELQDVSLKEDNLLKLNNINLCLREGEVTGIAGVEGNGQDQLVKMILGLNLTSSGNVILNGNIINSWNTSKRLKQGIALIPSDRLKSGAIGNFTLKENILLGIHEFDEFKKGPFLNISLRDNYSNRVIKKFQVKAEGIDQIFSSLSGGNQQKVVVGRSVFKDPKLLIAHHPTRGLDIEAIEFVHREIEELKQKGTAILLISSELDEILKLSDKVHVIFKGELSNSLTGENLSIPRIGKLMAGIEPAG